MPVIEGQSSTIDNVDAGVSRCSCQRHMAERGRLIDDADCGHLALLGCFDQGLRGDRAPKQTKPGLDGRAERRRSYRCRQHSDKRPRQYRLWAIAQGKAIKRLLELPRTIVSGAEQVDLTSAEIAER